MATRKDYYRDEVFSTRRIEALTDGVFAIAMTILILDITAQNFGSVTTSAQLWQALTDQAASFLSFIVSFLLLGSLWAVHMRQFEYIKHSNRHLVALNTIRLLLVVFIPFTTSINGQYQDLVLGRVILPLNFFLLVAVSSWQWYYAVSSKSKLHNTISEDVREYSDRRNKVILFVSGLVVLTSVWQTSASFILFLFVPLIMMRFKSK